MAMWAQEQTVTELAEEARVPRATVRRLVRRLGVQAVGRVGAQKVFAQVDALRIKAELAGMVARRCAASQRRAKKITDAGWRERARGAGWGGDGPGRAAARNGGGQ
jgi:histone H3/H4